MIADYTSTLASFLLLPALGAAGASLGWLVLQTLSQSRVGWFKAIAVPAALAGYSAIVALPNMGSAFPPDGVATVVGFALAVCAGFLLDRGSSVLRIGQELEGRRSPWPLLLWGIGSALYVFAPLSGGFQEARPALDRWAAAAVLVGAAALIGQVLGWVTRLVRVQHTLSAGSAALNRRGGPRLAGAVERVTRARDRFWQLAPVQRLLDRTGQPSNVEVRQRLGNVAGGMICAGIALWLAIPPSVEVPLAEVSLANAQSAPPTRDAEKAPANSLLVTAYAIEKSDQPGRLVVLDLNTMNHRQLPLSGWTSRWSPDGTWLACVRTDGDFSQLWVAAADGSDPRQLTKLPGHVNNFAWSADTQQIYFLHGKTWAQTGLWVIPVVGGTPEEILPVSEAVLHPVISPNGRTLAYFRGTDSAAGLSPPPPELKLLELANRQTTTLLIFPSIISNVTGLAWEHHGQGLLMGTDVSNNQYQLERITLADRQRQVILPFGTHRPGCFAWTPDGRLALMTFGPNVNGDRQRAEIWLIDTSSGDKRRLDISDSVDPVFLATSVTNGTTQPQ